MTALKEHTPPTTSGPTAREARKVAEAARQTEWTRPSFGKELFLGRLRLDLVDPWPTPSRVRDPRNNRGTNGTSATPCRFTTNPTAAAVTHQWRR